MTSFPLQRETPDAAGDHVQQAAGDREILHELDHLQDRLIRGHRPERVEDRRDQPVPLSAVFPGRRLMPARTRAFIDALVDKFGGSKRA